MKLKYVGFNGCVYSHVLIPLPTGGELVAEAHVPFSIDDATGEGLLRGGAYEEVVPEKKAKAAEKAEPVKAEPEADENKEEVTA